jgi:hypothetical protein
MRYGIDFSKIGFAEFVVSYHFIAVAFHKENWFDISIPEINVYNPCGPHNA